MNDMTSNPYEPPKTDVNQLPSATEEGSVSYFLGIVDEIDRRGAFGHSPASTRSVPMRSKRALGYRYRAQGHATFFAAGSMVTLTSSGTVYQTLRYSSGCFGRDAGWLAQSCTNLQDSIVRSFEGQADAGDSPFRFEKYECSVDSSQTCTCNEVFGYEHMTLVGSYTTAGNRLTFRDMGLSPVPDAGVSDAGTEAPQDYCVSGDTLTLRLSPTAFLEFTR